MRAAPRDLSGEFRGRRATAVTSGTGESPAMPCRPRPGNPGRRESSSIVPPCRQLAASRLDRQFKLSTENRSHPAARAGTYPRCPVAASGEKHVARPAGRHRRNRISRIPRSHSMSYASLPPVEGVRQWGLQTGRRTDPEAGAGLVDVHMHSVLLAFPWSSTTV